jgi:hypothetical protein
MCHTLRPLTDIPVSSYKSAAGIDFRTTMHEEGGEARVVAAARFPTLPPAEEGDNGGEGAGAGGEEGEAVVTDGRRSSSFRRCWRLPDDPEDVPV